MRKWVAIVVAGLAVVALVGLSLFVRSIVENLPGMTRVAEKSMRYEDIKVDTPKGVNEQTLAVFNFRAAGDADAELYAIGFARALADRLYCAPTSLTQQVLLNEIGGRLRLEGLDPRDPVADDVAIKLAKKMNVCWVITGDLEKSGESISIKLNLVDTRSGKHADFKADANVQNLPMAQRSLVQNVLDGMELKPSPAQRREVLTPNFKKAQTLRLYAQAYPTDDAKISEKLRWEAVEGDAQSVFPALRLLEFYCYGPFTIPELKTNKRLPELVDQVDKKFPQNSHIAFLKAALLQRQDRLADAEDELSRLVAADPEFIRAHFYRAYVAVRRSDDKVAVQESLKAIDMWPDNAYMRARLARAHSLSASNARRGHYHSSMTPAMRQAWQDNSRLAMKEATIAVKMDRDCDEGWHEIMNVSLELGSYAEKDLAFAELLRINPKDSGAYHRYADFCLPQWGGSERDINRLCAKAEEAFGKGSFEVNYLRASTLLCYPEEVRRRDEALQYVEEALAKSETPNPRALMLKSRALFGLKRYDEAEKIALEGVKKWDNLDWKYWLSRCYTMRYQYHRDVDALKKAESLFAELAHEIPYNPEWFVQWGWCLSHLGDRAQAKEKFLHALKLDPANEDAQEKLKYVQ